MDFAFVSPVMLLFGLIALAMVGFMGWEQYKRRQSERSLPIGWRRLARGASNTRGLVASITSVVAICLLAVALATPQWGTRLETMDRSGRDFLLVLDVSLSMLAQDVKPNRLELARKGIAEFVQKVRVEGGHRIGLIAFAGRATPVVPLTYDYDLFLSRLSEVRITTAVRRGSQLGDAIRQALYGFGPLKHQFTDLIVLTDGEDHGSAPRDAAQVAADLGVTIHTIGIGDASDGSSIPYRDGEKQWLTYNDTVVISKMHPGILVEIARLTDGEYASASGQSLGLGALYDEVLAAKPRRPAEGVSSERQVHRFQWFVAAAIALLALNAWLHRGGKRRQLFYGSSLGAPAAMVTLFAALSLAPQSLADSEDASGWLVQGDERYAAGDIHAAAELYRRAVDTAPSALAHFNLATARIGLYDFAGAIEHYRLSLKTADKELAPKVNYNLGVVRHRQAIGNMMTFQDASTLLEDAIQYYRLSLGAAPDLKDARYNLELAQRLLEEIRAQRVLPQANARTRDQKTSNNQGQLGNEQGDRDTEAPPNGEAPPQQADQTPQGGASPNQTEQNSRLLSTLVQRGEANELTAQDAARAVELARQRAEQLGAQRSQWRKARMAADRVEKFW
ncbi:MAG: VWA domain-containing protein [Pseudomonadota bacterium]